MNDTDELVYLTPEEAEAMLPDGEYIHTFVNPAGGLLMGADWERERILQALRKGKAELSGKQATAMGHGIYVLHGFDRLFIQTKD